MFIIFIFQSITVVAQKNKVTYDDDTIKVDGNFYCVMKKKNAGPMRSDFSVLGSEGTELIYFKSELRSYYGSGFRFGNDELYYEAIFNGTGSKVEITPSNRVGLGIAKLVAENSLVSGNMIDPTAEKRFVQLYHGYTPSVPKNEKDTPPNAAVIVNINNGTGVGLGNNEVAPAATSAAPAPKSKSPVSINGKQIIRDGEVIGKFKSDTTTSSYSQKTVIVTIYSEGGEKVAEAKISAVNPQEWTITTINDNKSFTVMYDSPFEKENLFKWIADKNYLTK